MYNAEYKSKPDMKFIYTDVDQTFNDEFQKDAPLSEQTGWWTPEGDIYVWT